VQQQLSGASSAARVSVAGGKDDDELAEIVRAQREGAKKEREMISSE